MKPEEQTPKEHVTSIYQEFAGSQKMRKTLTNLLKETVIKPLAGKDNLIQELLQNADDAIVKNKQ